jgi:hypothetical protein
MHIINTLKGTMLDRKIFILGKKGHQWTLKALDITTTHFGFCNWPLQLHTNLEGHM